MQVNAVFHNITLVFWCIIMLTVRRILQIILFPLILGAIIASPFIFAGEFMRTLWSVEDTQAWVAQYHPWTPALFILIQCLQVIIFIIPGEIPQTAGGFLFGVPLGVLYSLIGIGIGSIFNYVIGAIAGKQFIIGLVGRERFEGFYRITSQTYWWRLTLLLFFIPGLPKDSLVYVGGALGIKPVAFIVYSMLGRSLGIFISTLIGDSLNRQRWVVAVSLVVVSVLLTSFAILKRKDILRWLQKRRDI